MSADPCGRSPARNSWKACATAARSGSTASASRTSPRTGVPQHRADGRAAVRRAARSGTKSDVLTVPDRHRQRRLHAHVLPRAAHAPRIWSARATRSPPGRRSPTAGWAARPTTRRPSSARSAPTPSSTRRTRTTRAAGTARPRSACSFLNHAIVHPPVDRDRPPDEVADVCVHVEKETDAGLDRQRRQGRRDRLGAHALQLHRALRPDSDPGQGVRAWSFMVPMDAPGVKLICRASYEMTAAVDGQPVRLPAVRSRLDENDAILVLDKRARPVGERLRLRRRGEGQQLLPALRLPPRASRSTAARGWP